MKRFLALLLVLAMVCGLTACGGEKANDTAYPSALGQPVLGEAVAELVDGDIVDAAHQITTVGDALNYMKAAPKTDDPSVARRVFMKLLAGDYDEIGYIVMTSAPDCGYEAVYIQQDGVYYPVDPFKGKFGKQMWYQAPQSNMDLDALFEELMATCPYDGPMKEYTKGEIFTGTHWPSGTAEEEAVVYLTTPQYTEEQIAQWVAEDLTLDEWAEIIKVPADAVQMLYAMGYQTMLYNDNVTFRDNAAGIEWVAFWNAQEVFDHNSGNCAGVSNLMNYLLSGDLDEQGYVMFNANNGGHSFNYFKYNGIYVTCDFDGIPVKPMFYPDVHYPANTRDYIVYACTSTQDFGEWYRNEGFFADDFEDPNDECYLYDMWMFPREGSILPKGRDSESVRTPFDVWDLLPEQYKDDFIILYEREGYPLRFRPIIPQDTWPAEVR